MRSKKVVPVSVIVPCFNCEATISRAFDSILFQSALPAEVIFVDDCSTDETLSSLYFLKNNNPEVQIKVVHLSTNSGPGDARNAGWEIAKLPYLAFLDADDIWHPRKLELQYGWMEENSKVCLSGHLSCSLIKNPEKFPAIEQISSSVEIEINALLVSNRFPTRSVMLKREIKFRFKFGKRHSEDYLLWLRIMLSGGRAAILSEVLSFSFKLDYGVSGLSAQVWKMQKGELLNYVDLYSEKFIGVAKLIELSTWSCMKFFRRLGLGLMRKKAVTRNFKN